MGLRIPAHYRDLGDSLAATAWVDGRHFARDLYFPFIDRQRKELATFCGADNIKVELLVPMVAQALDAEDVLIGHVLSKSVEIKDADAWRKICESVAWHVLQRYYREIENRKWASNGN
jgi:hypothetical protein